MKQEEIILHSIEGDDFESYDSRVDASKLGKLYGMLSNIYRNPIGSIVREYASNAHDANVEAHNFKTLEYSELIKMYPWLYQEEFKDINMDEKEVLELRKTLSKAGKNEPILTGILKQEEDLFFYVKDYGIGMSPKRMKHIFFNYLSSTKEQTDGEIGGFGIGAKSAISYTHTFFIDTVYMNVKYNYIMSLNEKGFPVGKLLVSHPTKEDNGTCIRVPIKKNTQDAGTFINEIYLKLLYLPNVYIDMDPFDTGESYYHNTKMFNDATITESKDWKISTLSKTKYMSMHISMDNVPYTIDWTELSIKKIDVPLAIKFSTGELRPTPSRESVMYTSESIKKIEERITSVVDSFLDKWESKNSPTDDIFQYWKESNNKSFMMNIGEQNIPIDMKRLAINSTRGVSHLTFIPAENLGIPMGKVISSWTFDINARAYISTGKLSLSGMYMGRTLDSIISMFLSRTNCIIFNGKKEPKRLRLAYLLGKVHDREMVLKSSSHFLINIKYPKKLDFYIENLKLKYVPKELWRNHIKLYQEIIRQFLARTQPFDILIDPNFDKLYRAGKEYYKPESITLIKKEEIKYQSLSLHRGSPSRESHLMDFDEFISSNKKKKIFYTHSGNTRLLNDIRDIFITSLYNRRSMSSNYFFNMEIISKQVKFILVYKKDIKKIKELSMKNWTEVEDNSEIEDKIIKRNLTAYLMKPYMDQILDYCNIDLHFIDRDIYQEIDRLRNWYNRYGNTVRLDDTVYSVMYRKKMYDLEMVEECKKLYLRIIDNPMMHIGYMINNDGLSQFTEEWIPLEEYHFARIALKMGNKVDILYGNDKVSYYLKTILENNFLKDIPLYITRIKYDNYKPYETSLYEDFYEHKQQTNETS